MNPNQLVPGQSYYLLGFYHPTKEIPMVKTYIYVGKNLEQGKKGLGDEWYFQDPESYLKHGSFVHLSDKIEHNVFLANEDSLLQFYDLNGLIERLRKINPANVL